MQKKIKQEAATYLARDRRRKVWKRAVTILACVVVFCTAYALILPAITLENKPQCGKNEHTHTEECYTQITDESKTLPVCTLEKLGLHKHTDACLDKNGAYCCGYSDFVVHKHDASCLDEDGNLWCPLPEIKAHTHDESCYAKEEIKETHKHTDKCYIMERGKLTCTTPEGEGAHTHSVEAGCYDENGELICKLKENSGHQHTDECYEQNKKLICELPTESVSGEEQKKTICNKEEIILHTHTQDCFDKDDKLICGKTQVLEHVHTQECFQTVEEPVDADTLTCTIPEGEGGHTHTVEAGCYDENGELICQVKESIGHQHGPRCYGRWKLTCQLEEHTHSKDCFPKAATSEQSIEASLYTDESYTEQLDGATQILVSGQLPKGAKAKAYPVSVEIEGKQMLCAYDITIFDANGVIYEPEDEEPLQVSISSSQLKIEEETETPEVYYVPESGEAELVEGIFEEGSVTFSAPHFSVYAVALQNADDIVQEGEFGNGRSYYINREKNAFMKDNEYAKYYNEDSPIGVAGSFHMVAFDTLELKAHTNGNVLAKTLLASSNFGTNNYPDELSYVQDYRQVNSTSASKEDHLLVLGSANQIAYTDNKNALSVNGTKLDKPHHVLQDEDTDTAPFIDLVQVKAETSSISKSLAQMENQKITTNFADQNDRRITLDDPDSVGVCTLTAAQLAEFQNNPLKIMGFESGKRGTVIINVDCAGAKEITLPQKACIYIDGNEQSTNEVITFSDGKVIWNFTNAEDVKINTMQMTGIVLAPGATVEIKQNLNGTVVAENITVSAESHRTDFTGEIVELPSGVKDAYLILQKVDQENIGILLPGAEFELYKWNPEEHQYASCGKYICDSNGRVVLEKLNYNTAYKLEEVTAPEGYISGEKSYYFLFEHEDVDSYKPCKPDDFSGTSIENGEVKYIRNEKMLSSELTSITVKKYWKTISGSPVSQPEAEKIQFELWRKPTVENNPVGTYDLTAANNWERVISDLPKTYTDSEGNTASYQYYVKEVHVDGYTTTYQNNDGITGGVIEIHNTKHQDTSYELPETGGPGTLPYIVGGLTIICMGFLQWHKRKKSIER